MLLADDHPSLLEVVRSLLKTTDLDVVESVDNGEALFDSAMRLQPEVIVTDISMPRLNGFEAVERLRESGCSSRIVFLTVQSDPDFVAAALNTGAFGYVIKPLIVTDLLFAIQEAVAGRVFVSAPFVDIRLNRNPVRGCDTVNNPCQA